MLRLARGLDIDALLDSSVALSTLKLRLAVDVRLAQLLSVQLPASAPDRTSSIKR